MYYNNNYINTCKYVKMKEPQHDSLCEHRLIFLFAPAAIITILLLPMTIHFFVIIQRCTALMVIVIFLNTYFQFDHWRYIRTLL